MLRRSHKKSRDGCRECKRRHVKCDEARPSCRLCVLSERTCTYTNPAPSRTTAPDRGSVSSTPSQGTTGSPVNQSDLSSIGATSPNRFVRPDLPGDLTAGSPRDYAAAPITGEVNLDHAELLIHCFNDEDIFILSDKVDDYQSSMRLAFDIAHQYPYLLHELLAFSACHLAAYHPNVSRYHHLAFDLQTRAVALFNASGQDITPENCVPVLLFSTIIGQHLFADSLRPRDFAGLGSFIQRFTHCLAVQRGIGIIYQAAAPVLMASPLERYLTAGIEAQLQEPIGNDCAELSAMIYDSPRLTAADKEACIRATVILQLGFDAMALRPDEPTHLCFKWVIGVQPALKVLLQTMQPDAMVLLAYYGLLLHMCRNAWPVGTAGAYVIGMVTEHLGRDYPWLAYPRRRMAES
ncbi:hypothetical protein NLU13_0058 [Sarocladium strictum]|uniref:Zn(2)-C6 fungal-type domain-containing protein n=1 Tax=Sarocladium strictum TaxID=5046 RepID=A0AA39GP58_SARSR|nr:hypothetical protein NLU13_0058 [Sarocladium strictum]